MEPPEDWPVLTWKIGVEMELLAPPGRSRRDLAHRVAAARGGSVHPFFHPQSEPSKVPGSPVFENLTHGFAVSDADGAPYAAFVDDLTLQANLRREAPPKPGWYRIVADDGRLLRLAMRHCDPNAPPETVLDPLAALFGTAPQHRGAGVVRVADERGASVALCALLPGERERPCEIITTPLEHDHAAVLTDLLGHARALGFTLPLEGATHLHFDGCRLASAAVLAQVIALFGRHREALRELVGVNPNCIRLGTWPAALIELAGSPAFAAMAWPEAKAALQALKPTKYCDFNLLNLVRDDPAKHTFEVRILPSHLQPAPIIAAALLFQGLLDYCCRSADSGNVPEFNELLRIIDLPPAVLATLAGIRSRPAIQSTGSLLQRFP